MRTRRQQKHEMLLTFMANTKNANRAANNNGVQKRTTRPGILKTLLSLFI